MTIPWQNFPLSIEQDIYLQVFLKQTCIIQMSEMLQILILVYLLLMSMS